MNKVDTCAKALSPFFDAVIHNDWQKAKEHHNEITQLEQEADKLKKDLRLNLPTGLFLPVPRTDLLELLTYQDKIANKAKDIAGLIIGRKMEIPNSVKPLFVPFLECCLEASNQACKAINELDELLESGFRGNEIKIVEEMIVQLDELEHKSDEMLIDIRQAIFELESSLSPVSIIFLYKMVEWTGHLADCAHSVGGRLQILIAR